MSNKDNRNIRVFISSTFKDMQAERNYLMKHIFPELQVIANKHNVSVTAIDLRWGISEEQAHDGKVVGICLKEIEKCIPFFIGIILNEILVLSLLQ